VKSLSEIKHCAKCTPTPAGESIWLNQMIRDVRKRLPNPYCRDASCACHKKQKKAKP
jgi:hypothetical protein